MKISIACILTTCLVFVVATPSSAGANPLDQVGIEHNQYLECLMENGGDPDSSPLRRLVEECGFEPGMPTDDFVERYAYWVETDPFDSVVARMLPHRAAYTNYQFSFFQQIDGILTTAQDDAEADRRFAELELQATANLGTKSLAEQSIFAALSTARHSLRYWVQAWGGSCDGAARMRLRWWHKVLIVVGADLLGAAGGTLIGGPVVGAATGGGSSAGAAQVLD